MNIQSVKNSVFLENNTKKNAQLKIAPKSPQQKLPAAQISSEHLRGAFGVVDAKVLNLSFGSTPLYPVKLRKINQDGSQKLIAANFSQVKTSDYADSRSMQNIGYAWKRDNWMSFAPNIVNDFLQRKNDTSCYVVERNDIATKKLDDKVLCMIETTSPNSDDKSAFEIKFLQASPDIADQDNPPIKGSGELAMYGAVKLAKEHGFKKVITNSTNNSFYRKLGFMLYQITDRKNKRLISICELESCEFDDFLKRIEKKYHIK